MPETTLSESRRQALLRAAARVFRKKGYHATRIQDIADAVGMQKGSLYYYISSKSDLLYGLVEGGLLEMIRAAEAIVATRHTASQKLERLVEMHLRMFNERRDIFGIFLREDMDLLNQSSETDIRRHARRYEDLLDAVLAEGIASGEFAPDIDRRLVIKAIVGMCNGSYTWYRTDGRYPIEEIARLFTDMFVSGIRSFDHPPARRPHELETPRN